MKTFNELKELTEEEFAKALKRIKRMRKDDLDKYVKSLRIPLPNFSTKDSLIGLIKFHVEHELKMDKLKEKESEKAADRILDIIDKCDGNCKKEIPCKECEHYHPETKNEEKNNTMEMKENFVINARDAKLAIGSLKKAKPAVDGVPGKSEERDEEGKITQHASDPVPAKAAVPAEQKVFLIASNDEIMDEVQARMADQGFEPANEGQREYVEGDCPRLTYVTENDKIIRAAFKKCKSKDGYNAPGLAALKVEKKAADKAKKEKEKVELAAKKEGEKASEPKDKPKKARKKKSPAKEAETDGWPEESFDA